MSNVCCKEFNGWFKSFTKTERALAALEAVLLVVLIALLILLILHLVACSKPDYRNTIENTTTPADEGPHFEDGYHSGSSQTTKGEDKITPSGSNAHPDSVSDDRVNEPTEPTMKCSWTPSAKTTATIHYFVNGSSIKTMSPQINRTSITNTLLIPNVTEAETVLGSDSTATLTDFDDFIQSEQSDGEEAEDKYKSFVVALVKLKPPKDVVFGCILTIVSEYWTLTAASCIEAIEEIDSLDSFVIMEEYGTDRKGPLQPIEDVQIHPLYEGRNQSYDLAALKSARSLIRGTHSVVELASILDYALLTLAERLTILGYGAYRSIDKSPRGRALRRAHVHVVRERACAGAGAGAALRHLWAGRAAPGEGGGADGLCAGALAGRSLPCNYCGGAPVLRGAALLALMAENQLCGVACEPALYVTLPDKAGWIDAVVHGTYSD